MDELYFSVNLDNNRTLCIAPLTDRCIEMSGQELADSSGYFLFERCYSGDLPSVEIIAQIFSEEAAFQLRDLFHMD